MTLASPFFPPEFRAVPAASTRRRRKVSFYGPGPIVRSEIAEAEHPLFYGLTR